ncbi:biliverdin-producing heme oxygenase [Luteolibacter sp. AS25]|uniref:biliverdin-producing heme oxygenase n=1 Tax=Luteolibacter sp. AS25 TaxID=3135776 RepID=UPI00398AE038
MSSQNPTQLLSRLRSATATAHATLDSSTNLEAITSSPQACASYVEKFALATREVFARIDWTLAEKLGLPDAPARLGRYQKLPSFHLGSNHSSLPCFIGTLYVLEGSIHGGKTILETLQKHYPEATFPGIYFLKGFGSENTALWKRFIGWLQSLDLTPSETSDTCDAACETFACFQKHLMP